jgi:hypothetical protein
MNNNQSTENTANLDNLFNDVVNLEKNINKNKTKRPKTSKTKNNKSITNLTKNYDNIKPYVEADQPYLEYNKVFNNSLIDELRIVKILINKSDQVILKLNTVVIN